MELNFDSKDVTPFAAAIEAWRPGATGKDLVELFDGKAERTRALHWKAGRRQPPQWALDVLQAKLERQLTERREALERARQLRPGVGRRAGRINLAKWRVEQAKKKNNP